MGANEIVEKLRYNDGVFQEKCIIEARKNKEKIVEELLNELQNVADNSSYYASLDRYFLHIYAMFLLSEFREKRAFPIIVKLITENKAHIEDLGGEILINDLDKILASTYDGDMDTLYKLITNLELDEWIRNSAFCALVILQKYKIIEKDQIISKIEEMLQNKLGEDDILVITSIVEYIAGNKLYDKIPLVRKLYDTGRINEGVIGGYDDFIDNIYGSDGYFDNKLMIDDVIKEMSWWACFDKENEDNDDKEDLDFDNFLKELIKEDILDNKLDNKRKKIGRNDLCPCRKRKKV